MSTLELVSYAYLAVAGIATAAAVLHALRAPRRRREELEGVERFLLVLTGLLVGALWISMLPVFVVGWSRDRLPRYYRSARGRASRFRAGLHGRLRRRPDPAALAFADGAGDVGPREATTAHSLWPATRSPAL